MFTKLKEVYENRRRKETLDAEQQYHQLVDLGFQNKLTGKDADRVADVLKLVNRTFDDLETDVSRRGEVQRLAKLAATLDEALRNNAIARRALGKIDEAWVGIKEKYEAEQLKAHGVAGAAGSRVKAAAQARDILTSQYADLPEGKRAKASRDRDHITNELDGKRLRLGQACKTVENAKRTVKASKGTPFAVEAAQGHLSDAQRVADEWSDRVKADEAKLKGAEKVLAAV